MTLPWVLRLMSDALEQPILEVAEKRRIYSKTIQAEHHNIDKRLVAGEGIVTTGIKG